MDPNCVHWMAPDQVRPAWIVFCKATPYGTRIKNPKQQKSVTWKLILDTLSYHTKNQNIIVLIINLDFKWFIFILSIGVDVYDDLV